MKIYNILFFKVKKNINFDHFTYIWNKIYTNKSKHTLQYAIKF